VDRDAIARLMLFTQTCQKVYVLVAFIAVAVVLVAAFRIKKTVGVRPGNSLVMFATIWLVSSLPMIIHYAGESSLVRAAGLSMVLRLAAYALLVYGAIAVRKLTRDLAGNALLGFAVLWMISPAMSTLSSLLGVQEHFYTPTRGAIIYYQTISSTVLGSFSAVAVAVSSLLLGARENGQITPNQAL
jgi:hypothetical protein